MSHQIKIDADLNLAKLRRQFQEIATMVSGISQKHAIELFDKDSMEFLKTTAKENLGYLRKEYDALTKKAEDFRSQLAKMNSLTDEHRNKEKELLVVEKQRAELMRDMVKIKEKLETEKEPGFMQGLGSGLKGLPGGGVISKLLSGASLSMIAGLGAGALLAGGAWHVISRVRQGNAQYEEGLRSRVTLMGRGVGDYRGLNSGLAGMGYSPEDIRQAQIQATDIFGRAGATGDAVFQRARFARANGLDLGAVQGLGGGLRASMGITQGSKAFAELEASLMANKIRDAIGPYLETAASMLVELNEHGMNFDSSALTALGALVNRRGMSPEAAARMITDFDNRVKGSTGELNAFFQAAFAKGGVGGRTLGGSQEAVNLGLFGLDEGKAGTFLNPNELNAYRKLGMTGVGGMNKRFGGIRSLVESQGFGNNEEGVMQKGLFLQRIFGTRSGADALRYYNALGEASKATNPQDRQKILDSIKDQFGSNEEKALKLQGEQKQLLERIGEAVNPGFQMVGRTLLSIDNTLLAIARKGFGIDIPESPEEHQNRMLGMRGLSLDKIANMTPEETASTMSSIRGEIRSSQAYRKRDRMGSPSIIEDENRAAMLREQDMAEILQILRQHYDVAKQQLSQMKKPVTGVQGRQSTGKRK